LTNGGHIREEDLPLLAAGALPEEECAALRAHAAECAECAARLAEAHGRAAMLALAAPQEKPAATIKAELFARIRAEREKEERYRWPVRYGADEGAKDTGRTARIGWWSWGLAAAAALLLVMAGVELRESQRLSKELEAANHKIVDLTKERQRTEMLMDVLAAPDTLSVKLAGTPEAEKATGIVRYNARKGMVLYTAVLPSLPAGKIYQMWLVPVAGAPISAGIFAPGAHGTRQLWTAEVPLNSEAKAFAVTIEPAGGVPQPTGPKVLLGTS